MIQNDNNEVRKRVKCWLASEGITLTDLVNEYNQLHPKAPTTRQNLTNKLARQTLQYKELIELADVLGYDVELVKRK